MQPSRFDQLTHRVKPNRIRLGRVLCLVGALVFLFACSREVRDESDDAFITPSQENAVPTGESSTQGAGDVGVPAPELKTIYFPFDSSVLTKQAVEDLKFNAGYLRDNPRSSVQIEGHCDERGTVEYNLALGERRAAAARNYLRKLGIEGNRLSIISYGKERPADAGHDETAWAKNRRAQFVATGQ